MTNNASAHEVAAVLSQIGKHGQECTISFKSWTLTSTKRNYAQKDKKAWSLVFGIKKFHEYLLIFSKKGADSIANNFITNGLLS